jgi:hypothetical protein
MSPSQTEPRSSAFPADSTSVELGHNILNGFRQSTPTELSHKKSCFLETRGRQITCTSSINTTVAIISACDMPVSRTRDFTSCTTGGITRMSAVAFSWSPRAPSRSCLTATSARNGPSPSDRIAAASVDGRQVFRVDYAGLMEPYQCRNELGHDVMTCRCGKNSRERSFIECEASAAVPWNEVTATGCPIRFYPNPHYLNAANDSVCLNSSVLANVTANDGQTASDSRNQWHTWLSAIIIVSSLIVIIAIIFVYKACISKKWSWRSVSSADVQKCVEQSEQYSCASYSWFSFPSFLPLLYITEYAFHRQLMFKYIHAELLAQFWAADKLTMFRNLFLMN